jgi:septal ring factor EnvC (AmiA/AmiB activator)
MKLRTPLLNAAADDGSENGGAAPVNPAEALAKIEDRTLPMGQRLSVAAAALRGIDPTNQLAAVQERLTQAEATAATLQAQVEQANAERDTARAELTAREQDVTDLQARNAELEQTNADLSAREQDITARADALVAERIAALGYPAERLPASTNQQQAEGAERIAELREQVEKEKDPKKRGSLLAELRALSAEKPVEHGKN